MSLSEVDRAVLVQFRDVLICLAERDICSRHPAFLVDRMHAVDERTSEVFHFDVLSPEEREAANRESGLVDAYGEDPAGWPVWAGWRPKDGRWFWQRSVLDEWESHNRWLELKARQLGITWLACGKADHTALYQPGSLSLLYRQKEEEAHENVKRCWELLESVPRHLWNDGVVEKPSRVSQPIATEELRLRFPDGKASRLLAMTSASASGHGKTAALVVLDEFSRIDRAAEIMKAVQPAAGRTGKILIVSTANGRANLETGDGNVFHWLWVNSEDAGFRRRFLPWSLHPDRDQRWYDSDPEVRGLKSHERAEQYPASEHEAFTLTNRVYFEPEDLGWYAAHGVREPLYRMDFVDPAERLRLARGAKALVRRHDRGNIRVFEEPVAGRRYAIGADVATGRGRDYSAAYVIDLSTMALVAEFHGRIDEDLYAAQLHYLGRMYGRDVPADPADPASQPGFAKLAVEVGGGFGNAVIAPLRDRTAGRPAYGNLYRHVLDNRGDRPTAKPFGFPMNTATRPKAINGLDRALRERTLPWLSADLLHELGDFVHHDHGTSPRAAEGTNDDRVMAAAITLELYRLYGEHAAKPKRRKTRRPPDPYGWLPSRRKAA